MLSLDPFHKNIKLVIHPIIHFWPLLHRTQEEIAGVTKILARNCIQASVPNHLSYLYIQFMNHT